MESSRRSPLILAALIFVLALFVASTFSTWLPMIAISALATLTVSRRAARQPQSGIRAAPARYPRWLRWIAMTVTVLVAFGVCVAWRLGDHFGESINPILVGIDVVSHTAVIVTWLLWVLRPHRGYVAMLFIGLLVVLLCVAAGGTSRTAVVQTVVALVTCIGFLIASQVILRRTEHDRSLRPTVDRPVDQPSRRLVTLFSLFSLSLILMATSGIAKVTSDVLPGLQDGLYDQLKSSLDPVNSGSLIGGTRYVSGSELGSVRRHMLSDPNEVALRIYAERAPGYLRGTVFDIYERRRWFSVCDAIDPQRKPAAMADQVIRSSGAGRVPLESRAGKPPARFQIHPDSAEPLVTLEILNDPIKGNFIFLPLNARAVEATGRELTLDHHRAVRHGLDTRFPYVVSVGSNSRSEPIDPAVLKYLLLVPEDQRLLLRRIVRAAVNPTADARTKASQISRYLRSQSQYSLEVPSPPAGVDPIVHFLESKHAAHCEYFATATLLLLRSVNVPARYVTGYVADEYSDESLYWLARNRDAHAWVEAYDDKTQTWFAVESTPGRTYHTIGPLQMDENGEVIDGEAGTELAGEEDSMLSWAFGWLLAIRATDPLIVIFRFGQLPLFLVLIFLLWWRFWRTPDGSVDPIDVQSQRMLRQVDRICRQHNLVRLPHETLHGFAQRIEDQLASQDAGEERSGASRRSPRMRKKVLQAANWYRRFAHARYQNQLPTPFSAS